MKKNVAIIINSLKAGGAERVVSILLNELGNECNMHLILLCNEKEYAVPSSTTCFSLNEPLIEPEYKRLLRIPDQAKKINRYCSDNKIDVVLSFLNRPCYIAAMMRRKYDFPGKIIMCERTFQSYMLERRSALYRIFTKRLLQWAYAKADLILANSVAIKEDLLQLFNLKKTITVIYNPIVLNEVTEKASKPVDYCFDANCFYFVTVGGLRPEKNQSLLIDAFSMLKELPCKLIMVGTGPMESVLKDKVKVLELQNNVVFTGLDNNPFRYVNKCQCFVLSSDVEGFPNVLLEALACSRSIISTDCNSGPRELLAPETAAFKRVQSGYETVSHGILTPVKNTAALADAMIRMYKDNTLRNELENTALNRARQFDVSVIMDDYRKVILRQ